MCLGKLSVVPFNKLFKKRISRNKQHDALDRGRITFGIHCMNRISCGENEQLLHPDRADKLKTYSRACTR